MTDVDEEWEEFKKIPLVAEFLKHFAIPEETEAEGLLRESDEEGQSYDR
jgi:hypothetical protein